jgi:uncharacterized protein YaiI (UPF0178 family)
MEGRLRRADNVICREIDNEIVVITDNGLAVHVLNKTAARIWEMCSGDFGPDEIVAKLCERYDVSPEKARADVKNVLAKMMEKGLLKLPD